MKDQQSRDTLEKIAADYHHLAMLQKKLEKQQRITSKSRISDRDTTGCNPSSTRAAHRRYARQGIDFRLRRRAAMKRHHRADGWISFLHRSRESPIRLQHSAAVSAALRFSDSQLLSGTRRRTDDSVQSYSSALTHKRDGHPTQSSAHQDIGVMEAAFRPPTPIFRELWPAVH
jgi:hypothetical protein